MDSPSSSSLSPPLPTRESGCFHVLIGVTGSVAAIKLCEIVHALQTRSTRIRCCVVMTEHAAGFVETLADWPQIRQNVPVYRDVDEWSLWRKRGDPVLHIDLRRWADLFLIAPCDANTLAKLANGLCDNLLTCIARAWNPANPLLYCLAMNTYMYEHPLTNRHRNALNNDLHYTEIPVVTKQLICGDEGAGAMAEVESIVDAVLKRANNSETEEKQQNEMEVKRQNEMEVKQQNEDETSSKFVKISSFRPITSSSNDTEMAVVDVEKIVENVVKEARNNTTKPYVAKMAEVDTIIDTVVRQAERRVASLS